MLFGPDARSLVAADKRIQALDPSRAMWRAANGLLKHQGRRRFILVSARTGVQEQGHFHKFARHTASAPLFGDSFGHDFVGDGGLHLTIGQLRSSPAKSHGDLSTAPLEQSLSTLDVALNRVVQFPLFTSPLFQVLPLDKSSSGSFSTRFDQRWCYQLKAIASAAESLDQVEETLLHTGGFEEGEVDPVIPAASQEPSIKELKAARAKARFMLNRQRKLELDAWDDAVKEYRKLQDEMCRKKLAPNLPAAKALLLSWFEPLRDRIAAEFKAIEAREQAEDRSQYGPYLIASGLSPDVLAVLTMHKVMASMMQEVEHGCLRLGTTAVVLGDTVDQESKIRQALKRKNVQEDEGRKAQVKKLVDITKGRAPKWKLKEVLKAIDVSQPWPSDVQAKVGAFLIESLLSTAHIIAPVSDNPEDGTELRPAFMHVLKIPPQKSIQQSYGAITCDKFLRDQLANSARFVVMPYMPMIVPPRSWKGYANGAYYNLKCAVMKTHGSKQQREAVRNTPKTQLTKVFKALDALGATSWKINTQVLNVLEHLWANGGGVAGLVGRHDDPLPSKPDSTDPITIRNWRKQYYGTKRRNSQLHSQRCDLEIKLSIARKMRNEECFYYPHNLDFRGRAYPLHPHLNHLGSDSCRGVLLFARGRPLGEKGLDWIKIHLANVYGNGADKLPFNGRVAFVENHMKSVMDSAENPLNGGRWWMDAEDPFQCLATCIEVSKALSSPNVKEYISNLPVHQDGSCNGLQHYAALGRDKTGARAVNLLPGDAPADVYSDIAARVRAIVEEDAQKDAKTNPNAACAQILRGHVDRKLVKQTVMTSVYGVTFVGARVQIMNRMKDKGVQAEENLVYRAGCYAARVTLDALGEMFKEARFIMNWLGDCAKIIATDGDAVRWVTPLGLPVIQPYRRPGKHVVKTILQHLILRTDCNQPVMVKRQRSAFPPNFVHSMDGSHMMMTAVACQEAGLSFAGVHDSFWTHAGDVEQMNRILRDTFVELYRQPILEKLLESFQTDFPNCKFPPLPDRGDLNVEEVRASPYFFN